MNMVVIAMTSIASRMRTRVSAFRGSHFTKLKPMISENVILLRQ